ncbi:two-component regulator propeller domain-containing protein [Labilibaculum sp.]|uniref:hybrid sensor histidine kinase/response regulator transcription factor n=1 Tax=Labilibaculum sp. TaxID=2060723 RepID=UPI002AA6FF61|nr:two-component regulator propeller domain-containing protein [Labilibaculum sp.]
MNRMILIVFAFVCSTLGNLAQADNDFLKFVHYTNVDGLPSSYVKSITQDQDGFIWAATRSSVCRFDGNKFENFQCVDDGKYSDIQSDKVFVLCDTILVCRTIKGKFYQFDFNNEYFKSYEPLNEIKGLEIIVPTEGGAWLCVQQQLKYFDGERGQCINLEDKIKFAVLPKDTKIVDVREKNNKIVALTENSIIYVIDLDKRFVKGIDLPPEAKGESFLGFFLDSSNKIWLATSNTGICRINIENGQYIHFSEEQKGSRHILHNMVHCLAEDSIGRVWMGTENGLCVWSPATEKFIYQQFDLTNPDGINTNPIYNAFKDSSGNIWFGSYFGGINLWCSNSRFFKKWKAGTGKRDLSGNVVSCLVEDQKGDLWIGLEDMGLNKMNISTGEITEFQSCAEGNGLNFNNLHCLIFESPERLWIGTYTHGINILNTKTGRFEYITTKNHPLLPSDNIYHFLKKGNLIYISTSSGIAVFNTISKSISPFFKDILEGVQIEYMCDAGEYIWLSSFTGVYRYKVQDQTLSKFDKIPFMKGINFVKIDSKRRVWIGDSYEALCYYYEANDKVVRFNKDNGFPVSWIFGLEEEENGDFWASSDKGLVKFNPETKKYILFDLDSGIPFEQFNYRASYKDSRGNIYFGGNNGMVSFYESGEEVKSKPLDVVFTEMQLFNKVVVPGVNSPLKKSLNRSSEINLKYKENVFTIGYTALNYENQGKCQYAYYLENFDKSWNYVGNRGFATYTNLSPGNYTLHVKASTDKSEWGDHQRSINIHIKPPFYLSIWGYLIYFFIVCLIFIGIYLVGSRIQKSKAIANLERREKEYAVELNQAKLEFFTNISHEFRTPLSLIIGPLSNMIENENISFSVKQKFIGIEKNVKRLLRLVNELLDFRKVERGKETLQVSKNSINTLLQDLKESFSTTAEMKGVDLILETEGSDSEVWFDYSKMEKVLVNLLSNAFNFTDKGDSIRLTGKVQNEICLDKELKQTLVLSVLDTGHGIESDKLDKIFDRYFQAEDKDKVYSGSGIGLAFVKGLVNLHKGSIVVESKLQEGTKFTISLPVSKSDYSDDELTDCCGRKSILEDIEMEKDHKSYALADKSEQIKNSPSILVIDDNLELLEFIRESLQEEYNVTTASRGEEGLARIAECSPELIISDVMMPGIDGLELTKRIKTNIETSHIPVILLTAKGGTNNEYIGLKTGADLFIEKPFYPQILSQNICNILNTRRNVIERFKKDAFIAPADITHSESDREFVQSLTSLIIENLDQSSMDVSFITKKMGISRSLLHIKLKRITDCSATEFVRTVRLREAVKLISDGKCNISEAAYRTGFSNPAYFSRRFKEFFGKSPRDYFEI